ncbi:MAG: DUF4157 domain-containing protein [Oscillatoriaceae cyanobacterium Prado104]|jgi:hypothetical protein|nr:DUF4157 domain-containing protein [Oscillatoriaceae cyanobacterium Prado104]
MERQYLSQTKNAIASSNRESAIARYSTHPIEELQGAIGNRAVNQLLANKPIVQAKPMFRGLSHELVIQPKLTIGEVGDKYEQEADRISQQVVDRIQTHQSQSVQRQETAEPEDKLMMKSIVQRQSSEAGGKIAPELETSIQQEKGSGQPLAENIRKPMERAFGSDFSSVKIHSDTQSDRLNQSIQARAFTTGKDIFFRQGTYNPGSRGGQELIAHELTHVVQQGAVNVGGKNQIQRKIYHGFKIDGKSNTVWQGSAENFYKELSNWLETEEAPEDLKTKWSFEGKGKKKIIGIIKDMMAKGRKRTILKEGLHFSTALQRWNHVFIDRENAIRKILAEEYRDEATKKEGQLATEIIDNSVIVENLKQVAEKIRGWDLYQRYQKQMNGEYGFYRRSKYALYKSVGVDKVLRTSNDLTKLISAIHDVTTFLYNFTDENIDPKSIEARKKEIDDLEQELVKIDDEYFKAKIDDKDEVLSAKLFKQKIDKESELRKKKKTDTTVANEAVKTPDEKSTSTYDFVKSKTPTDWKTERIENVRPKGLFTEKDGVTSDMIEYIEEKSEVMKKVRENKMLVEVGPSYTTGRLMQLCETLGCSDDEKIAVALAIFAFWNKDYWKSTSGIHRFHFVMDMCKNYVPSLEYKIAYPEHIGDLATFLI